jgi:hypothetical protein
MGALTDIAELLAVNFNFFIINLTSVSHWQLVG